MPARSSRQPSCDAARAVRAVGVVAEFNAAGVLDAGDVHIASRIGELCGESDDAVLLACALAARAPRLGHVCVDLASVHQTVSVDVDAQVPIGELPWPEPADWLARVARSVLVGAAAARGEIPPLHLEDALLYLRRCFDDETVVAREVMRRVHAAGPSVDEPRLQGLLARMFGGGADPMQRSAAERVVRGRFAVISGGPGTGKTTTIAKVLALVCELATSGTGTLPQIAVTAPTGKAAERLGKSIAAQVARLPAGDAVRQHLGQLEGTTLHRLLGVRPTGVTHDREAPLPHDVVVVDEASMVSLALMAQLARALRPDARLVLAGDAAQLASVEAGVVLGDIVGPAAEGRADGELAKTITVLRTEHRFGAQIGALGAAVRVGDDDAAVDALRAGQPHIRWVAHDQARREVGDVHGAVVASGRRLFAAAMNRDAPAALDAIGAFRILCAHRHGANGVAAWTGLVERWLRAAVEGYAPGPEWYIGRPVLITENDSGIGLFNGDSGVVVTGADGRPKVAFARAQEIVEISPYRLGALETVHAMTIHKSQGSQFASVVVVVPDAASQLLTRELLYTAVTRARDSLIVVGAEDAIRDAVRRPIARASGLRGRLWAPPGQPA
jgi:exodeoxyribonuclease V alpha subunit